MFAGHVITGDIKNVHTVRTGIEYMISLAEWYTANATDDSTIGFSRSAAASPAISDLRRTDAPSGPATRRRSSLGLFLPDL